MRGLYFSHGYFPESEYDSTTGVQTYNNSAVQRFNHHEDTSLLTLNFNNNCIDK